MSGTWNPAAPPYRAGVFINVEAVPVPRPVADAAGVVAVIGTADWGPTDRVAEITNEAQATQVFGSTGDIGWQIKDALKGEGTPGRGGATAVRAWRMTTGTAAASTLTLGTTIKLDALYKGSRGNNFKIAVIASAADPTNRVDVLVYEGSIQRESYLAMGKTDIQGIVDAINRGSTLLVATYLASGTLATIALPGTSMTGGSSGAALTATEYQAARDALEFDKRFGVVGLKITDSTEIGLWVAWADRLNANGTLLELVIGGALDETSTTAIARTATADSQWVVNLFGELVDSDGVLHPSCEMAPRVAGVIANAGIARPITFASFPDLTLGSPPGTSVLETLVSSGVVPFYGDAFTTRIQRGRTTLRTITASEPVEFQNLLFVRKLQYTFRQLDSLATEIISNGGVVNSPAGRASLLSRLQAEIDQLISEDVVVAGSAAYFDPEYPQEGDRVFVIFAMSMAPGIEQILGRMTIPTSLAA